jgi:hypothetical protein
MKHRHRRRPGGRDVMYVISVIDMLPRGAGQLFTTHGGCGRSFGQLPVDCERMVIETCYISQGIAKNEHAIGSNQLRVLLDDVYSQDTIIRVRKSINANTFG